MSRTAESQETLERPSGLRKTAAALALAATAFGLAGCGDKVEAAPINTPSVSTDVTPSATPEATPEVSPTDIPAQDLETMPIPEALKKYETMSLDEFMLLPVQERLTYFSWLGRDRDEIVELWHKNSGDPLDQYPETISESNTAQEILTVITYNTRQVVASHFNYGGEDGLPVVYDQATRDKMLTASCIDLSGPAYIRTSNSLNDDQFNGGLSPAYLVQSGVLSPLTVTSERVPDQRVVDASGKEYPTRYIEATGIEAGGAHIYTGNYVLVEYTDYAGDTARTWISE